MIETECFDELNKFGPNNSPSIDLIERADSSNETSTNNENETTTKSNSKFTQFFSSKSKEALNASSSSPRSSRVDKEHSNSNNGHKRNPSLKKVNQNPFKFLQNLFKRTTDSNESSDNTLTIKDSNHINHNNNNNNHINNSKLSEHNNNNNNNNDSAGSHQKESTKTNHVQFNDIVTTNGAASHHLD